MRIGERLLAVVTPLICVLAVSESGSPDAPIGAGNPVFRASPSELAGPATPGDYGDCGPDARPETALQGQVPVGDQVSGRSALGYQCNVRRVSSNDVGLRGQNFQLAWYEDCAYVSTVGLQAYTGLLGEPSAPELDGIAVIDAADPRAPRVTDVVQSPIAKSSHEAIEVNQERGLLVTTLGGLVAQYIEVYNVADDCTKPKYLGRYDAGIPIFHGLRVSDDGRTVYATDTFQAGGIGQMMHVIDISEPQKPRRILTWDPLNEDKPEQYGSHDLDVSADGNRAYLGTAPYASLVGVVVAGEPSVGSGRSLAILDTSDIQARKPNADVRVVSTMTLANIGHTVQRMTINGRRYLLVSGEEPLGGPQNCPWAWGHIVDITDETKPAVVSDLKLEVNQKHHCPSTSQDRGAIYSIHYVGVDREQDTRLVFYTYYTGGLRVFDVRDPAHPKEIAYYQPPATPGTKFPAASPISPDSPSSVFDYTTSVVRYRPDTGALWVVSVNGGFQILQLTGKAARQAAEVRVGRKRAGRMRTVPVRVRCDQPCAAAVKVNARGKTAGRKTVTLPRDGVATVWVRLPKRLDPRARLSASAVVHDRLTGERQLTVRTRPLTAGRTL